FPGGFYDSLLHWEVNKKSEIALSFGFLNDRILLDLAYYRHTCDNQLLLINTPLLTGFDHVVSNFPGKVENKGYEFILKADIIKKEDFKINLGFSYVMNRNKLIAYPDFEK